MEFGALLFGYRSKPSLLSVDIRSCYVLTMVTIMKMKTNQTTNQKKEEKKI